MPLAFSTAIYSLIHLGQLKQSQSILIHSACGGVGIAALQVSQMTGVITYVTAGSEEKTNHLMKAYGIPREHIFNSRDSSFLAGVMKATNGRGVDLVLASHSGDLLRASCLSVAEGGKIINIAQRDMVEGVQLPVNLLLPNASYSAVDMLGWFRSNAKDGKRLLQSIVDLYVEGRIRPISPVRLFSADAVKDCFRHMQTGQHIGKLGICLGKSSQTIKPVYPPKTLNFHKDASYLLVGGLGGLGNGLARWMVQHNARHLIFLSRRAGEAGSDKVLFNELESQGCSITAVKGSVCNPSDVKQAISSSKKPLRGIFNISMVLQDASILKMSLEEWNAATGPKVRGTWNLHQASLDHRLDFFMLFSSMCGILGMPRQANYASSNTFIDSFVQFRHRSQLPASVLDLGAVEGIGHTAMNPQVSERSRWVDNVRLSQKELFTIITLAVLTGFPLQDQPREGYINPAQIITGFRNADNSPEILSGKEHFFDSRLSANLVSITNNTGIHEAASANKLQQFVISAATNTNILRQPSASKFIATQIAVWVFDLLLKPVDDESEVEISRSLSDVGLDSLAAVELRSWWKKTFGLDISVLEVMSFPSFAALGQHAVGGLAKKFATKRSND